MQLLHHYDLQPLNSFGVPAWAEYYIPLHTIKDITDFLAAVKVSNHNLFILGGGSNTLFVGDFYGYMLHVRLQNIEVIKETSSKVLVKAAAGVNWHELVLFCVEKGYGGIENLSLIPGTVGAAPLQNIGAYGVELKDIIHSVETIELCSGKKRIFSAEACAFGYRTSIFKTTLRNQYLITGIIVALHKEKKFCITYGGIAEKLAAMQVKNLSFKSVSEAIIALRKEKLPDPAILGNAGSFFQNPWVPDDHYQLLKQQYPSLIAFPTHHQGLTKISAAWLIEAAGFKGLRTAHVGVYNLHALVLVHYGGGTGKEILDLSHRIQQKVADQFNIKLIPEVGIIGSHSHMNEAV